MKVQAAEFETFVSTDLSELAPTMGNGRYLFGFVQPFKSSRAPAAHNPDQNWVGPKDPAAIAQAQKLCPDCVVSEKSFKAIALTKNESTGEWDAWVVSSDNKDPRPIK